MKLQHAEFQIFTCRGYPNFGFILGCEWTHIRNNFLSKTFWSPHCHSLNHNKLHQWTYVLILCQSDSWSAPVEYYMVLLWWHQFLERLTRYVAVHTVCTTARVGCRVKKWVNFICFENEGVFVWKALTATYPVNIQSYSKWKSGF